VNVPGARHEFHLRTKNLRSLVKKGIAAVRKEFILQEVDPGEQHLRGGAIGRNYVGLKKKVQYYACGTGRAKKLKSGGGRKQSFLT